MKNLYVLLVILSAFLFTANVSAQNAACITWELMSSTAVTSTTGNISGQTESILGMEPFSSIPYTTNGQQLWIPITGWPASSSEDPGRYAQFDASPTSGNTFTVTTVSFKYGDYPNPTDFNILKAKVYYSTNGWTTPGTLLNPTPLAYLSTTMQSFSATGLSVAVGNGQTFSLRIYPYAPTGGIAMARTFAIHNNIVICGTTAPEVLNNGSICGTKFNDINSNGVQDNGEAGLSGWTINLTYNGLAAPVTLTTTTGADGSYCFEKLTTGRYAVSENQLAGWVQISPVPGTYSITLTSGLNVVGQNFGNHFCIPTITGTTPGSTCGTGTVTLGATASAGTINWFAAATGGTSLGTGTSFTTPGISITTTYYIDATDACGTTAARIAIVATVVALPVVSAPASVAVGSTITLSPTTGGTWTSSNPLIASVTNAGVVTGVSAGTATFTFTNTITGCSATTSSVAVGSDCIFLSNSGFEIPVVGPSIPGYFAQGYIQTPEINVPSWHTTASDGKIEIWDGRPAAMNTTLTSLSGNQFAELNCTQLGTLYQKFTAIPNQQVLIKFLHMGRYAGLDKMELRIGPDGSSIYPLIGTYYDNYAGGWTSYSIPYQFSSLGGLYQIRFVSISSNGGDVTTPGGNFLDNISIECLKPGEATVTPGGPDNICKSANLSAILLSGASIGGTATMGTWSIISGNGILSDYNLTATPASVTYTPAASDNIVLLKLTTNSIPAISATRTITINALPAAPAAITGTLTLCVGSTTQLADATTGGTWSSGTLGVAIVGASTGLVTGISAGTSLITYTTAPDVNGCTNYVTKTVTVNASPTITGTTPAARCGTGTVTLGATASAGTINWYDALTGGNLVGTGTSFTTPALLSTTTYYVDATSGGCTTGVRIAVVATVNALPVVSAPASVNVGSTITLSPTTGGTWISNNPLIASVTNAGVVTGVSAGTATFTFTNTITGCSATTSSVTIVGSLNCDQLSATANKIVPGDCVWSLSLNQPANLTGIGAIQVLALSPNQFATGTGLGSGYTSWLASGSFATGETYYPPTGIVPGGNLSNFLTMSLSYVTSPQTIVVNWLDASGKVVCSKTIQLNCQTTCVGIINEAVTCVGNKYNLAYSFTNNATYDIHTIDYTVQSPGTVTISPATVILSPDVASTSNSGIQNILISGAVPGDNVSIIAKFMKSTGCCWCFDTLHVIIPTCGTVCDSLSVQAQGTPEGCCYSVSLTNNSTTKFSNVQFELLSGGIFGSMSTAASGFAFTNVTPFNLINLIKLPPVSGVIGNGTFSNVLNMCVRQYSSPNQVVEVRWMKDGKVICRDTLRFDCVIHPDPVGCSQPLEGTLECLTDGTVKYNFRIQNNSNFDATGFNIVPTASNVAFSQTAFSNVSILSGGQVSPMQSIILSGAGVGQGQNICFTITIFKAISGTGSTVYSDCCHTDTICVVSPVCGEQLGSICGMKFSDANGNGSQDTGELGLAGWTISLTSYNLLGAATTVTAVTDATGAYCFTNLTADNYTIKETQKSGWSQTFPAGTGVYSVTLTAGAKIENKNFGNQQIPTNIPCVYLCNTDFEQFPGVTPPSGFGWYSQANIPCWKTTATDGKIEIWHTGFGLVPAYTGTYFAELNATQVGTLYQTFTATAPQSVIVSFAHQGRYLGFDIMKVSMVAPTGTITPLGTYSDNNSAWNFYSTAVYPIATSGTYTLKFESVSSNNGNGPPDGGNFLDDINVTCPSSICGIKYNDLNGDGQKQATEPVLPNWEITLTGPLTMTILTGADGSYCFNNLTPGTYTVSETPQDGWAQSFPAGLGTHSVTLTVGQNVMNQDFGNHQVSSNSPCTDFEDGTNGGWQLTNTLSSIVLDGTNHYLHTTDQSGASALFNESKPLTGNWTNQLVNGCGSLCFDVNFLFAGNPYGGVNPPSTFTPYLAISGNGFSAYFIVTNPILAGSGWHTYCAPLSYLNLDGTLPSNSDGYWVMGAGSNSDWNSLLSNVTRVSLPVDPTSYQGEQFGYDNICLKNTGDCVVPCCDKVTIEPLLDASGKTTCCAKITVTCEVKSIGVTVTNGTLSSVSWNCSATIPTGYIGQSAVTFIPNGCAPTMTTCINAKAPGISTITYDIVFSNGETCQKKVEMNCGLLPPGCCERVKVEPVIDATPSTRGCCAKITTTCEVKAIIVTVTNGTLSSANWNCTTPIPTGYVGQSIYTFAPGICIPEMTTCVDALKSGTVTITYDIIFSNGEKCQKSVQLDCSVSSSACCDKVTVEPAANATGAAACCVKFTATCAVRAIGVTVTNGTLSIGADWSCGDTPIPDGYVGQSAFTFIPPAGCAPILTTCVDALKSGIVTITYDIVFANGEKCQKSVRLDCAVASECVTPPTGMVLWLPGDNNANDISGLNNHGTLSGGATYSTGKVAAAFKVGNYMDKISVPDNSSLNFGTGNFSADAWFKTTDNIHFISIADKSVSAGNNMVGYRLFIIQGYLYFQMGDGSVPLSQWVPSVQLANGAWHFVAATIDRKVSDGGKLYIDGTLALTFDPTTKPGSISNTIPLTVAGNNMVNLTASNQFTFYLDEVELFNRAITDTEIASIFNAGSAGKCKLGSICGTKFNDLNGNGRRDKDEPGIPEWRIVLAGTSEMTALTDKDGNFCFYNLEPGEYKIGEETRNGWQQILPAAPGTYVVTLPAGQNLTGLDFGNRLIPQTGSICGSKFNDLNGNGRRDEGEPVLSGWTILLGGSTEMQVITNENGEYCFDNLKPGTYKIGEESRVGWLQMKPAGGSYNLVLAAGVNLVGQDFGNMLDSKPASICGIKFNDLNGNSIQDSNEPGLPNWTINLTGSTTMSAVTDGKGRYCFTGLKAGTYTVAEANQALWHQTAPEASGTYTITLVAGEYLENQDFGNQHDLQCVTPPIGMLGWWPGDDNANDISSNGDFGTLVNGATFAPGMVGSAFSLMGSTDYVNVPNRPQLNPGNGDFTIDCWIQTSQSTGTWAILDKRGLDANQNISGYGLYVVNGLLQLRLSDSGTNGFGATLFYGNNTIIADNQWHFVAATVVQGTNHAVTLYIDGVMVSSSNFGLPYLNYSNTVDLRIGEAYFNAYGQNTPGHFHNFQGMIDEVEFIFGAVSEAELAGIYNAGSAGKCKPAVLLGSICGRKFNDMNGNGLIDARGDGEPGIPNWTIKLTGAANMTTTTDANGNFCFNNLPAGQYTIAEVNQPGWIQTAPLNPNTYTVTLNPGEHIEVLNFGNKVDPTFGCVQAPSGLVGWWPGDGHARDISGFNNHGTLGGGAGYESGKVDQAFDVLRADYIEQYISIPSNSAFNFGKGNLSLDAWVKTKNNLSNLMIVGNAVSSNVTGTTGYSLNITQGKLCFLMGDGSPTFLIAIATGTSIQLGDDKWHFVAATVDRTSTTGGKLYIDGNVVLTFDPTIRPNSITNNDELYIAYSGDYNLHDQVDEVELFNRVITGAEIASIFNAGSSGKCKLGTICGMKFNDLNGNGRKDEGEPGIADWQINLGGPTDMTVRTEKDGSFCFTNLNPGDYKLTEEVRDGWTQTAPGSPGNYTVSLPAGGNLTGYYFGNTYRNSTGCVTPPSGMVAWWPLDETDISKIGTILNDDAGFNNVGIRTNGPAPVPAMVLSGLQFDGTNDYVEVPDQSELNFGRGDFSFDAWIQTTMASGAGDLVDKRISASGIFGYSFFINDGYLSLELANGTLTNYVSPVFVSDGKFHHIAVTVSRANPRGILFYIDGVSTQFGDPTTHSGSLDVKGPLRLGSQSFATGYLFKGILDEVELFNRVISKDEIASIYKAGSSGKCKLGSICGTKYNDLNGNGRRDDGEPGIAEWHIMLDGTANLSAMTDRDGNYCFTNLIPGDYKILEELRPDWQQKAPAEGYYGVNLFSGQNITGKDFGNMLNSDLGSICGIKFNDLNGNGIRDKDEPGIPDWTILLGGTADFSMVTDKNGEFCFTNLKPGTYKIGEQSRQGWIQTAPSSRYYTIDLAAGKHISDLQFGNRQRLVIVSPFDGAKIQEKVLPIFKWLPPMPIPPGTNNYEIKIVEVLGNQSPEEAIQSFASFFDVFTEIAIPESGELSFQLPESAPKFEVGKKYAWVIKLGYLMSEVRTFTIQGANEPEVVSVKLVQPPLNQLNAKDLWNAVLLNTTDANLNVTLYGTLELTGQGIVAEGKSILMNLPPGAKGITSDDIKIGFGYSIFDRWGNLIFLDGEFTMCIQIKDEYGVEIGSGCIVQNVKLPTSVSDAKAQQSYQLDQNYPNPFNATSTIGYYIPQTSLVNINVYDIYGKEIKVLVNEEKAPGHHEVVFDREDFVSGIYFYTLKTAGFIQSRKMILMK